MTQAWSSGGGPQQRGATAEHVTLLNGTTFCISGASGDVVPGQVGGLFVQDVRILSEWALTIDGHVPEPLATESDTPHAVTFIGRMPPAPGRADSALLVVRHRRITSGLLEEIELHNTSAQPVACTVRLSADADFADLFEVKEGRPRHAAAVTRAAGPGGLGVTGRRHGHDYQVHITSEPDPTEATDPLTWSAVIPARGRWRTRLAVTGPDAGSLPASAATPGGAVDTEDAVPTRLRRAWRQDGPELRTEDPDLAAALERSIDDLGALRIYDPDHPRRPVVAAGAPWFMALFGRDSLLTSWMVLPVDADLAAGTLLTLAAHQGRETDAVTEEEPGRILHELRFGPAARLALGGRNAYYGTADATSLFVALLGELHRWGRHPDEVTALLPHADRALAWIDDYGDADGDGFVEYRRKTDQGLVNQGWKDSWDGITFADGRLAEPPIALAEVQAYTYAAYRARADLATAAGDRATADHWSTRAQQLKRAFNDAYWLPDRGWFALGLDRNKHPIDALSSNMGHCLWTGIVDDDKAAAVAAHLVGPDLFSGWGIRTLAESMTAYNPMSYHNGSIWPHDNALCAAGLMRYGFTTEAQRIAEAILEVARHFGHRLPELFCGFRRDVFRSPVPYPTSCSPQAWAAAAPLLLLRTLLRLDPDVPAGVIHCDPALPGRFRPLRLSGLRVGPARLTIDVTATNWSVTGLEQGPLSLAEPA